MNKLELECIEFSKKIQEKLRRYRPTFSEFFHSKDDDPLEQYLCITLNEKNADKEFNPEGTTLQPIPKDLENYEILKLQYPWIILKPKEII